MDPGRQLDAFCRIYNYFTTFSKFLMEYINTRPLTYMIHRIQHSSRLGSVFTQINESCHLGLKFQCPETVLATAKRINEREVHENKYEPSEDRKKINWVFGEFKIFIWTVVYKCLIHGLQIQDLTLDIVKEIQNIFRSKSICFIHYEIQLLVSQKCDLVSEDWDPEQLALFSEIMRRFSENGAINWRRISFNLYESSKGRFFRNINHCREKWFNHLNPQVKKGEWSIEEDIRIFTLIKQYGPKWSMISRQMGKIRTEHMVKNRYNRYYRHWKFTKETTIQTIWEHFEEKVLKPYLRKKRYQQLEEKQNTVKMQASDQEQWMEAMRKQLPLQSHPQQQNCAIQNEGIETVKAEAVQAIEKAQSLIIHVQLDQAKITYSPQIQNADQRLNKEKASQLPKDETVKIETEPLKQQPNLSSQKNSQFFVEWNYYPFMNMYYSQDYPFHF